MFQIQPTTHRQPSSLRAPLARATRPAALAATAIGLLVLGAAPATARPDPGPPLAITATRTVVPGAVPAGLRTGAPDRQARCAPQRVGTQYVACDHLTGNGVPAPGWIPKR